LAGLAGGRDALPHGGTPLLRGQETGEKGGRERRKREKERGQWFDFKFSQTFELNLKIF